MNPELDEVITHISRFYGDAISEGARHYVEVDIGKEAKKLGYPNLGKKYLCVRAIVPLKEPAPGMKVRIDGRTFVNYAQFYSGVVVPEYVARETGLPYRAYRPNDSMILNFN